MAQKISTVCDPCMARDEERPGAPWSVSMLAPGARKPQSFDIDLCDDDAKSFAELLAFLTDVGRPAGTTAFAPAAAKPRVPEQPAPGAYPCPGCDYVGNSMGGLRSHTQNSHGRTVEELDGSATIPCPHPDCDRKFTGNQGVQAHQRTRHAGDVIPLAEAS